MFSTWMLRRAEQLTIAIIVTASLGLIVAHWISLDGHRGGLIDVERMSPADISFQLDINRAKWAELSLLPGIGETLARRIVESRNSHGPFLDFDDLERVHGIGPKTVARIRPYILPIAPADSVARE